MKLIITFAILLISLQSFDCESRVRSNARLNFFDIDLLRNVAVGKSGNVMVSPVSVRITLAMLLEGARGTTEREIRNALRLSPNGEDRKMELMTYFDALRMKSNSTTLESSNGVFVSKRLPLKKEFETAIKNDFSSEITKMDFEDANKAAHLINEWVAEKTHRLISEILDPGQLATTSQMILTNALYFKSTWKYSFDAKRTRGDCFYRSDDCEKVEMMELETELPYVYVDDLRSHAVELPYEGGRHSMVLIVPMDRDGCEALIGDLPFIRLQQIRSMMHITDVTLTMPKFTVKYNADLVEPLSKMKISTLFTPNSNLSGIFNATSVAVSNFQHKVFMSVDEAGTVAAAVSAAAVVPLSFNGIDVTVDRPFVFFIRDNDLGIVLFEGKIEEPTAFVEPPKVSPTVVPSKASPIVVPSKASPIIVPSKPQVVSGPVQTVTLKPAAPAANGPREVLIPQILPKASFDSQTPATSTTPKPNGFFDAFKNFFG